MTVAWNLARTNRLFCFHFIDFCQGTTLAHLFNAVVDNCAFILEIGLPNFEYRHRQPWSFSWFYISRAPCNGYRFPCQYNRLIHDTAGLSHTSCNLLFTDSPLLYILGVLHLVNIGRSFHALQKLFWLAKLAIKPEKLENEERPLNAFIAQDKVKYPR
jgi:hypothetical protein